MIRRTFLRGLLVAAAGLGAGGALADPVDEILAEIREQGFTIVRVQRTWLGRVRIIAENASYRREVVIDPTTGEIRRDLLNPRRGRGEAPGPPEQPDLGNSRGIGQIEEEPSGETGSEAEPSGEGGGDGSSGWGGGWGSKGALEGDGASEGGADGP